MFNTVEALIDVSVHPAEQRPDVFERSLGFRHCAQLSLALMEKAATASHAPEKDGAFPVGICPHPWRSAASWRPVEAGPAILGTDHTEGRPDAARSHSARHRERRRSSFRRP